MTQAKMVMDELMFYTVAVNKMTAFSEHYWKHLGYYIYNKGQVIF